MNRLLKLLTGNFQAYRNKWTKAQHERIKAAILGELNRSEGSASKSILMIVSGTTSKLKEFEQALDDLQISKKVRVVGSVVYLSNK